MTSGKNEGQAPGLRLAQLRAAGMHAIRFEFVVRLLRAELRMDTLSIYWDHGAEALSERMPGESTWRLVLGRGRRVAAEFPDPWVTGYPRDDAIKAQVEAKIDRLVGQARAQLAEHPRPSGFVPRYSAGAATAPPRSRGPAG
jgi:hypothetical protein